jgi:1,3-beta-glucan synthase subunit FKS1, domain-1
MQLLDSRASRMSPNQALLTLHADYIGGQHANYRKWYFAAQLDLDDAVGHTQNPGLQRLRSKRGGGRSHSEKSLTSALERWRQAMNNMSQYDRMRQIALYLLCWGEAAQVRFVPECLCFIFKCADDYYRSPECQSRIDPVPEGLYLRAVIKPLYRFIRDQGYEVVDGKFVRRERDHHRIIGYDDINQLFWYPEGIARIVLTDKARFFFFSYPSEAINVDSPLSRPVSWTFPLPNVSCFSTALTGIVPSSRRITRSALSGIYSLTLIASGSSTSHYFGSILRIMRRPSISRSEATRPL